MCLHLFECAFWFTFIYLIFVVTFFVYEIIESVFIFVCCSKISSQNNRNHKPFANRADARKRKRKRKKTGKKNRDREIVDKMFHRI